MSTINEVITALEQLAPPALQESYDNSGLLIGNTNTKVTGALLCIDVTEQIIDEAVKRKCSLVISHHPLIFSSFKRLTGKNYVERCIIKAIKKKIAVYAIHTNLDNVLHGVNQKIA